MKYFIKYKGCLWQYQRLKFRYGSKIIDLNHRKAIRGKRKKKIVTGLLGSGHGRTPPIKALAQKQGCCKALKCPYCPQKDAFKKKGSAVK
jgi:hypothetical protein